MATCPELLGALEDVDSGKRILIDLSECTFLDSSAVRVLVDTARSAESAGGELVLVANDPAILRVLEIASLDTMIEVHETVEAAAITPES